MKKLFFSVLLISTAFISNAQSVAINSTGSAANSSAMLDVTSTSKGVLLPRMTVAQRNAISSPATGLMIYQTDAAPGMYVYTGSAWTNMSPIVDLIATRSGTAQSVGTTTTADVIFNSAGTSPSISGASYNTSTGEYTVGVAGNYTINVSLVSTASAYLAPSILVNGNAVAVGPGVSSVNLGSGYLGRGTVSMTVSLSAGDVVKILGSNANSATSVSLSTDGSTRLSITKL